MNIPKRLREFGGLSLLRTYWRMGALGTFIMGGINVLLRRCDTNEAYRHTMEKVVPLLRKQYYPLLLERKAYYDKLDLPHDHPHRIWTCWLQGLEQAPEIVKACIHSQKAIFSDWNVVVLNKDNISDYVEIPEDIIHKYQQGKIPHAMYADLIRLELLIKYGGTWMDASVLCTSRNYPPSAMEGDLFLFQYFNRRTGQPRGISNWFITSCANNKSLLILRDMLYQYWRDYDCAVYYFIFHQYFAWIMHEYPQVAASMPRGHSIVAISLGDKVYHEKYNDEWMQELLKNCCFHKLTYRLPKKVLHDPDSFYTHIVDMAFKM